MKKGPQDPEQTRRALLQAAAVEFSQNGLQGARVMDIARRAGANVQAIYYHFGNKDDLYAATIESLYRPEWFAETYAALDRLEPAEAICYVIDFMFESYSRSLGYAMITEQDMHGAWQLKQLPGVRALFATLLEKIQAVLDRGARAGMFRPRLDAARVYISITSLTGSYIHKMPTNSALLGRDFAAPEEFDAWREYVGRMVLAGLGYSESGV